MQKRGLDWILVKYWPSVGWELVFSVSALCWPCIIWRVLVESQLMLVNLYQLRLSWYVDWQLVDINYIISTIIIHQIFLLAHDWPKHVTWPNIPQLKLGNIREEYPRIFPNFQNCACCEKDLKDNKDNSRHLGRKYARIFVLGHYLFLVALALGKLYASRNR